MRILLSTALLLVTASMAHATGFKSPTTVCSNGGMGEGRSTIRLYSTSTAAPRGPVTVRNYASASETWLGGTKSSGDVEVGVIVQRKGKLYVNNEAGFSLSVVPVKYNADGQLTHAEVSGRFIDAQTPALKGRVVKAVYRCSLQQR